MAVASETDAPLFLRDAGADTASLTLELSASSARPALLSARQLLPASGHDATEPSCCLASHMRQTPGLPPKQMRHYFCAKKAPVQHRSRCVSASAAPAPTQRFARQHLPAPGQGSHGAEQLPSATNAASTPVPAERGALQYVFVGKAAPAKKRHCTFLARPGGAAAPVASRIQCPAPDIASNAAPRSRIQYGSSLERMVRRQCGRSSQARVGARPCEVVSALACMRRAQGYE